MRRAKSACESSRGAAGLLGRLDGCATALDSRLRARCTCACGLRLSLPPVAWSARGDDLFACVYRPEWAAGGDVDYQTSFLLLGTLLRFIRFSAKGTGMRGQHRLVDP